jgi:imidazolonepropionase-like amidohydrolase
MFVRVFPSVWAGSFAFWFCALGSAPATAESIAFVHTTVIDPAGTGSSRPDQTVVISGGRIISISPAPPPRDTRVIDGRGKFLIPGLCDMHVHIAGVTADARWSKQTLLPLLIANGITTVRDMGGDLDALQSWGKEIEAGQLIGPRIYCAGPMLDGGKSEPPSLRAISTPDDGREAVRDLKAKGADFIKVLSRLDRESYLAIADEAKKQGMTFVGHVPNSIRASEASEAGQKSIEHIFYSNLTFDCSAREEELRRKSSEARAKNDSAGAAAARDEANASFSQEKAETLWKTFVRNNTWVVPTLVAMRTISQQRELARKDPMELRYLPSALRKNWAPEEIEKQVPEKVASWYGAQFQIDLKIARSMHDAGVQMMAGSDSLDPFNFPGRSLHDELELLTEVGFTSLQALQAATSQPAKFLNLPESGTIRSGAMADLVLLEGDPLTSITNTTKIAAVVVRGKYFGRADLDRLLEQARAAANPEL